MVLVALPLATLLVEFAAVGVALTLMNRSTLPAVVAVMVTRFALAGTVKTGKSVLKLPFAPETFATG
ncbi:hypothetical protein CSC78_17285 [Pseudoxanthomonas japonensis]|uniref:Uncharacterized protein n=1 Tax=Pseudoxanthomonas japonensis TaxID=69284 RepID=A0ABQ6ZD06_9GAMM|nr:hypothetical protein CSC78_17285 [Pseudoxanthomonas japonensis]